MTYVKSPCTVIFTGPTDCGKTKRMLDLIESQYKHHFGNIVILCPTLQWNTTYLERDWIWKDNYIFTIDPGDKLLTGLRNFQSCCLVKKRYSL